jgi:ribosomal protein S11
MQTLLNIKKIIKNNEKVENKEKSFYNLENFKQRTGNLILRKNHSNFFVTLTDIKFKVIISKSAAAVLGKKERRRKRKAPQTIGYMINTLDSYFKRYNIHNLNIILRLRPGRYLRFLIHSLMSKQINIYNIFNRRKLPYSYTRGRRKKY